MKRYSVDAGILQSVVDYLGSKPFTEVEHLVRPLLEDAKILNFDNEIAKAEEVFEKGVEQEVNQMVEKTLENVKKAKEAAKGA